MWRNVPQISYMWRRVAIQSCLYDSKTVFHFMVPVMMSYVMVLIAEYMLLVCA